MNVLFDSYIVDPVNIGAETAKYNLSGIQTAVSVDGSTQNRADVDQSWTVEMAIPFSELVKNFRTEQLRTAAWKINFYRIDGGGPSGQYFAWSPTQGSFHQPVKFGRLLFR